MSYILEVILNTTAKRCPKKHQKYHQKKQLNKSKKNASRKKSRNDLRKKKEKKQKNRPESKPKKTCANSSRLSKEHSPDSTKLLTTNLWPTPASTSQKKNYKDFSPASFDTNKSDFWILTPTL